MRVDLIGHQLDISPSLRRLVTSKFVRIERLLNNAALSAQVVLSTERVGCRAEVTLHARDEKFLHGTGKGENFRVAVGAAIDKLSQQAKTLKGKYKERRRQAGRAPAAAPVPVPVRKKRATKKKRSTKG
jgi:putative sigma-54 modulation protein